MDALEDSWWPSSESITEISPFTLPPSSQWIQKQDDDVLIIRAGGDPVEYRTNPNCLPFLMLLDIVQITYLQASNSSSVDHPETFYKAVVFLGRLRGDFLAATQKEAQNFESKRAPVPESMRRWLCRLLRGIPHDPHNRKLNAELLNKAYLEVDVLAYGLSSRFPKTRVFVNFITEDARLFGLVADQRK